MQIEELHATEVNGFSADIEAEIEKLEWCDLMIWQFLLHTPLTHFGMSKLYYNSTVLGLSSDITEAPNWWYRPISRTRFFDFDPAEPDYI